MTTVETAIKLCKRCKQEKPVEQFYGHDSNADGLMTVCKSCHVARLGEAETRKRETRIEQQTRAEKFINNVLDMSELSLEELQGSFIWNDDNTKVELKDMPAKMATKFRKEFNQRITENIRNKTPKALEILYDLMTSDLTEPQDRAKIAFWWVERTIGKTPETLLLGKADQPYEAIFEKLEGGSREQHRAISQGVIDVEVVSNL